MSTPLIYNSPVKYGTFVIENHKYNLIFNDNKYSATIPHFGDKSNVSYVCFEKNDDEPLDLLFSFNINGSNILEIPSKILPDKYIYRDDNKFVIDPMMNIFIRELYFGPFFDLSLFINTPNKLEKTEVICSNRF